MANPAVEIVDLTADSPPKKTTAYKNQATSLCEHSFPRVSCKAISVVLQHVDFDFTRAFHILSAIQGVFPVEADVGDVFPMPQGVRRVFLKNERPKKKRLNVRNHALLEEIDGIPELNTKENDAPPARTNEDDDDDAERGAETVETLVECGCCYGDFPPEDMHECEANDGHKVCKGCIYLYVTEQLDGNNSVRFQCIVSDTCSKIYPTTTLLDQILTPKLKKRVHDREFRSLVTEAEIEGVWSCPVCADIGYLEQPYPSTVFCVPCQTEYCRACNEVVHPKKTCEQVKVERERLKNPIHRAHEAMSRATIRSCPSCATEFQKYDGCNKMTCPSCGTLSCYLCEKQIKDYSHFCNTAGCRCDKCKLWGNAEESDRQARRRAGLKELQDTDMTPEEIEKVLASPPVKQQANAPPPPVQQQQQQQDAPGVYNAAAQQEREEAPRALAWIFQLLQQDAPGNEP